MKKNILAVAVAGALVAPMAMADAEVYGTAHVSFGQLDNTGTNGDTLTVLPNNSNIGFKGSEDLGGGLKAEYQAETALTWDTGGWGGGRDTFVGFAGDWGQARVGRANTPFKNATAALDPFGDTVADYNGVMGVGANGEDNDTRLSNALWYNSPNMSGFSGSVMYGTNDARDINSVSGRERSEISVGGTFKSGPFFVGAGYQQMAEGGNLIAGTGAAADTTNNYDDMSAWRVGGSYTLMENTTLGLAYEQVDSGKATGGGGSALERNGIFASLTHKIGATTLALSYSMADEVDNYKDTGADMFALGAMHALSKNTTVYAMYTQLTVGDGLADNDGDGVETAGTVDQLNLSTSYGLSSATFAPNRTGSGDYEAKGLVVGVIHKFSSK